jgi:hypothetical protein
MKCAFEGHSSISTLAKASGLPSVLSALAAVALLLSGCVHRTGIGNAAEQDAAAFREESLQIDITKTPFSTYGAWLSLTQDGPTGEIVLHDVHGVFGSDEVATLDFTAGSQHVKWEVHAGPTIVAIDSIHGHAELWLQGDNTLAIRSTNLGLRVSRRHSHETEWVAPKQPSYKWPVQSGSELEFSVFEGIPNLQIESLLLLPQNGYASMAISVHPKGLVGTAKPIDPAKDTFEASRSWDAFLAKLPKVPANRRREAVVAWYNIWSCYMRKQGFFHYDSVLMSKSTMTYVWSWDHCFVALALAKTDPEAALDQWMLPFPLMNEKGCLPDGWNPVDVSWYATKPPIHGWALSKIMDNYDIPTDRLRLAYQYLTKWTEFWMSNRYSDKEGLPNYLVAGNDSGWDNSTLFDMGPELESPDLSAYLILQFECLGRVAKKLGDREAEARWIAQAAQLRDALFSRSWNGERFVARLRRTHASDPNPTSLLEYMPLVLGSELTKHQFDILSKGLELHFLTANGLATERLDSPKYKADGYWRGPIWAPSTYLIVDGLARGGRRDLASEIAKRFCDMIAQRAGGNFENFDAITGRGQSAEGYTWTAAVNLLLMEEYLQEP